MRREIWRHFDFWLFGTVIFLSVFGVVMVRSAIAGSESLVGSDTRQMQFLAIGVVIILAFTLIDYHFWASLSRVMYLVTIVFLVFIFVLGQASFGAQRWLDVGFAVIQPSEVAKIVVILVLANYFSKHQTEAHDWRWAGTSFLLVVGIVVWILLQPNLSNSIVMMVIWFAMLWVSGLPTKYILILGVAGIVLGLAAFPFLEPYQQARVLNFVFPEQGATYGNTYNVDQALITIGTGGLWGEGYGNSTQVQLRFLKVRHTDFIFSAMASEFGFVGTLFIMALLVFVIFRCLRAARLAPDKYGSLIAFGFATLIFFQTIVNIGVNLNVIPVTGLTLPFISYGGTSLVSLCFGIGLVESVISRSKAL